MDSVGPMSFEWSRAALDLRGFGGEPIQLLVQKTGLPFFDVQRLYGAIDLYIGLREDVEIHDEGAAWRVTGRSRSSQVNGRAEKACALLCDGKEPDQEDFCGQIKTSLTNSTPAPESHRVPVLGELRGVDSALQAGVRDGAAAEYETLQSGQASKSTCCVAEVPLSDGLLAFAGRARVEGVGDMVFLPVFEGRIDLAKVVSPLRAWLGAPNVICSQALALLALKTALFAEGYEDRLSSVVFNTSFPGRRSDNYSGLIAIRDTAVGRLRSQSLLSETYRALRTLMEQAWTRKGRTKLVPHALAMAGWVLQPTKARLSSMITSQECLVAEEQRSFLAADIYVKEVFGLSYGNWSGDHEAVRKLAKAVASAIYFARQVQQTNLQDRRKAWYDEVTMLRSAPSARAFIERVLILIEQGHREHSQVGTGHRGEDCDPAAVFASIGATRADFEAFRDLFRMYLVQESTYAVKEDAGDEGAGAPTPEDLQAEGDEDQQ